jgi:DNA polymerase-3 subunit alpha
MKHSPFVHLHQHSQYSLLDGACKIGALIETACHLRFPALALTDHGNMFGAIEFYNEAVKRGIKPILGIEAYIAPTSRFEKAAHGIKDASFHLTLLVKNETGYRNLMKLATIGYLEGFYYRPRMDKEVLARFHEGLIGLSGCLKGEIAHHLRTDDMHGAERAALEYREIFGKDNFYIEIYRHGIEEQDRVVEGLRELAKNLGIPLVATNDVHYIHRADYESHDALLCIGTGANLDEPNRMRYATDQFYLKSAEEMAALFKDIPEALENTLAIAQKCNLELDFTKTHLPRFDPPDGKMGEQYLRELCEDGLIRCMGEIPPDYKKRLEGELSVIRSMNYVSYFLIVWDFIRYAREKGIPVGPGRGSAAGSLVAFALGVTDMDPIRHGLIFERFLNPERVSMPDIDIDFCYERRGEVIDYVKRKYGQENVAQIITFGTMMARGVVRDVGRVMNFSYQEVDRIAKLIPAEPHVTLDHALKVEPRLKQLVDTDARVAKLIEVSKSLEGITRHASTHAAGVVISDVPLTEHTPLFKTEDQVSTQYSMNALEKIGLLKMDFLGLKTLTVIDQTCKIVNRRQDVELSVHTFPLDDSRTYDLLSRAETSGVFQLESTGMRDILKKLKPRQFGDLVALLALYRPGPIGSGMVDDFIRRKHNPALIKYDHPALESILKDTYGVILYQEQVMRIVSELAGFSLAKADSLRRAIGKKIPEVMEREKQSFIEGATKNDVRERIAEKIWGLIEYFSGYGFNKSHSAAYAMISFQTAYLKANAPVEFMTALLTSEKDNTDKIVRYIEEAKRIGIEVLPPSVSESFSEFTCLPLKKGEDPRRGTIRFGLSAVKNVGTAAIESIVTTRFERGPFRSFHDFVGRVDLRTCNRKVLESLIKCGAMDEFRLYRSQLVAMLDQALDWGNVKQRDRQKGQLSFVDEFEGGSGSVPTGDIPQIPEWPENQSLAYEKELLGFYVRSHPLSKFEKILKVYGNTSASSLAEFPDQAEVTLGGIVNQIQEIMTKKGEKMAFLSLEDLTGHCEVVVFPNLYKSSAAMLAKDTILFVRGRVDMREDDAKVIANEVLPLGEVQKNLTRVVSVDLATTGLSLDTLNKLKEILSAHKGAVPLYLTFRSPDGKAVVVSPSEAFRVDSSAELFQELENLLGENVVKIRT